MTIKADNVAPCWEITDLATGVDYHADQDFQPHYRARVAAAEAIADIVADRHGEGDPVHLVARQIYSAPCVILVCDGCGYVFDEDEYCTHFDPAESVPFPLTDVDWIVEQRAGQPDRHFCPGDECRPGWCDDCGEQHHGTCPDLRQPVPITDGQLALLGGEA